MWQNIRLLRAITQLRSRLHNWNNWNHFIRILELLCIDWCLRICPYLLLLLGNQRSRLLLLSFSHSCGVWTNHTAIETLRFLNLSYVWLLCKLIMIQYSGDWKILTTHQYLLLFISKSIKRWLLSLVRDVHKRRHVTSTKDDVWKFHLFRISFSDAMKNVIFSTLVLFYAKESK